MTNVSIICHYMLVHIMIIGNKINGELFLELPEFLQELELSPSFKRLIIKKAKQVYVAF